jgi:hypothetical protein
MEEQTLAVYLNYIEQYYNIVLPYNIINTILDYVKKVHIPFAVNKQFSLDIMKHIISQLDCGDDKITINENMHWNAIYDDDPEAELIYKTRVIDYRHKLAIVEIDLELDMYTNQCNINGKDESIQFYKQIKDADWHRSTTNEIYSGTSITNDKICLIAFLHDSGPSSDTSYPDFTYDESYGCWIVKEDFWGAPQGIDLSEGTVTILDFSDYINSK